LAASKPSSIAFTVGGRVTGADIARLCTALGTELEAGRVDIVVCNVAALVDPDVATVDALARMQLVCRRLGCRLRLEHACPELCELIDFMGLRGPLCTTPG
jgi:ABC-type transporter Mla MlaB component